MKHPWPLEEWEFYSVIPHTGWTRYVYFVQRVAWWGQVWVLGDNNGLAQSEDERGNRYLAVWPHAAYAYESRTRWIRPLEPELIPAGRFFKYYVRHSQVTGLRYNVFPTATSKGYLSEWVDLDRDYRAERNCSGTDAPWAHTASSSGR